MNLHFNIHYNTVFGQELVLNIIDGAEDGEERISKYHMTSYDGHVWDLVLRKGFKPGDRIDYFYSVHRGDNVERTEWRMITHRLELNEKNAVNYTAYDNWVDIPEDSYLYTSAFTECVSPTKIEPVKMLEISRAVRLKVRAPQLRKGQSLAVVGKGDGLGNWNPDKGIELTQHNDNEWIVDLDANTLGAKEIEFKFFIRDKRLDYKPVWEANNNRTVELTDIKDGDVVVYCLPECGFDIYPLKLAGTQVPVFSLRSKESFGVGDFGDLKKMIDFSAKTRQRVLQVLPINDTTITHTWTDSYPYSCISIFALHPQYVDLTQLPSIANAKKREEYEKLRKELNALPQIDYERVNNAKTEYLHIIFEQEGKKVLASTKFKAFFKEAQQWLVPYGQYCYLRDKNGTADFSKWPDHNQWNEADRKELSSARTKAYQDVSFYYYVQFILNTQMADVHDYARSKGVILKGDIPIGVNRYGCDVWTEPRYFNLNGQAGAPPDSFSTNGQNWGFPTYNWDEMVKDGCQWWVRRFQNMAKFFDAYRIDHVLGFFRIWEIPINAVHGLLGQFQPALGMTREEVEGYGLHWQEELFTTPFITDWVLDRMFGDRAQYVRDNFIEKKDGDHYRMRPEFDTQRKVEAYFSALSSEARKKADAAKTEDEKKKYEDQIKWNDNMRDGLYALISDVLFVRDHKDENKFHPRISVQFDFIFESLYDSDKAIFNRLYNDYYYRRNNQFWYREAMKKLPRLVNATRMLVCAEDLGMVPDCVSWVMNELKILSLEIQSMPKDPHVRFGHLSRNPYRSVCTISSHDTPTLRQWWDEDWERTQAYYGEMLYRQGPAPHPLPGWLARDIVSRHLTSPSMLCILTIQDWLSIDERLRLPDENAERINIPANPRHYWRYRMHLNIEDLIDNNDYVANVSELITQSGRK
ncbi:MAG: 4-alpha-glucanotransferase [Prevotella sp.]|nr:4-alpha-glucanotransferase [Prevotella sp.]